MALQVSPVAHWPQSELQDQNSSAQLMSSESAFMNSGFPLDEFDNCFMSGASNGRTPEVLNSEIPSAYACGSRGSLSYLFILSKERRQARQWRCWSVVFVVGDLRIGESGHWGKERTSLCLFCALERQWSSCLTGPRLSFFCRS